MVRRTGYVYIRNVFAGTIKETDEGYVFSYDEKYLERDDASSLSLTMPIDKKEYFSSCFFPFFDGLIPEGWLLDIALKNFNIDKKDRFGLLLHACKDPIGNVSVRGQKE